MNRFIATWETAPDVLRQHGVAVIAGAYPANTAHRIASYLYDEVDRGQADPRGHFSVDVRLSELLLQPALHIGPSMCCVLPRVLLHMPPMARFVRPGNMAAAVPAHQDIAYNRHLGKFWVVWAPLVPIDQRCGGMAVYPGSHTRGELPNGHVGCFTQQWHPAIDTAGMERVELHPLAPGDVVIIDDHVVHESMPNVSDVTRLSLDYRFFGEVTPTTRSYLDVG